MINVIENKTGLLFEFKTHKQKEEFFKLWDKYEILKEDLEKDLNKMINKEKDCLKCKSKDTYLTNLREGFKYRCNNCGEYFK